jgi:hypothetical protein
MQARIAIVTAALTVGCGGSPLKIENCKDQYGRGATALNVVKVTCDLIGGPEVSCRATADNSADLYVYCPLSLDATNQTQWTSSDPSVGVFDPSHPGHLRAVGSGMVTVTANYYLHAGDVNPVPSFEHPTFLMNGDAPAERAIDFQILVFGPATSPPKPILSGVQITLEPERGPVQSCITTGSGTCSAGKLVVVPGRVTVMATKDGYQPLVKDVQVPGTNTSFSTQLDMVPL